MPETPVFKKGNNQYSESRRRPLVGPTSWVCDIKVAELPIRRNSQESERRGTRGLVFGFVSGHGFSRAVGLLGKLGFSPCGAGKLTVAKASGAATCGTAKGRALIQTSRSLTLQKLTHMMLIPFEGI